MTTDPAVQEELAAQQWAQKSGYAYSDWHETKDFLHLVEIIPLAILREYKVAPLQQFSSSSLELGLSEQTDRTRLPELQQQYPKVQLTFKAISQTGVEHIQNSLHLVTFATELSGDYSGFHARLAAQAPKAAFQLIAQLAYLMRASDIHIEPSTSEARIRFRIDGTLHPITTVATEAYKVFLSDLQTKAEIKWGSDEPQSGRISFALIGLDARQLNISMRIETIPSFHGEEIVVRLFSTEPQFLHLENMGFSQEQLDRIEKFTQVENGMILTVGPTGSGKTSTLYAIINKLNSPEVKIVTLEDPVEYDLPGISQIPIHSDDQEMFAEKLRAVLREDPNVIMIGEIRDIDTAKTALQAALTGHLVLSTFHATSAATAVSRLLDMIGNNPLLPSALHMIQAQRLVRRICPDCVESYAPSKEELELLRNTLQNLPQKLQPDYEKLQLKRGGGCAKCHGIGYKGRVGIVEQLPISQAMEKLIASPDKTTAQDIEAAAIKEGMITLQQDAMLKVAAGVTTLSEVKTIADL